MKKVSLKEIKEILSTPLNDLIFKAQTVHKKSFPKLDIQLASLLSIKTGSCPEDCSFCSQSTHFDTDVDRYRIQTVDELIAGAQQAHSMGATRYCMVTSTRAPAGSLPRF